MHFNILDSQVEEELNRTYFKSSQLDTTTVTPFHLRLFPRWEKKTRFHSLTRLYWLSWTSFSNWGWKRPSISWLVENIYDWQVQRRLLTGRVPTERSPRHSRAVMTHTHAQVSRCNTAETTRQTRPFKMHLIWKTWPRKAQMCSRVNVYESILSNSLWNVWI